MFNAFCQRLMAEGANSELPTVSDHASAGVDRSVAGSVKDQETALSSACSFVKRPTAESHGPTGGDRERIPAAFDRRSDVSFRNCQRSGLTRTMISKAPLSPPQQRSHPCRSFKSANAGQVGFLYKMLCVERIMVSMWAREKLQKHPGSCAFRI